MGGNTKSNASNGANIYSASLLNEDDIQKLDIGHKNVDIDELNALLNWNDKKKNSLYSKYKFSTYIIILIYILELY